MLRSIKHSAYVLSLNDIHAESHGVPGHAVPEAVCLRSARVHVLEVSTISGENGFRFGRLFFIHWLSIWGKLNFTAFEIELIPKAIFVLVALLRVLRKPFANRLNIIFRD